MDDQASNPEVGVMKLQVFYETFYELLSEPEEKQDSFWAYKVCQQTRFVVQKIFECFPNVSEVQGLLKILDGLPGKVKNARNVGPYKDHLHEFASSMEERLDEMKTYVADMSAPLQEQSENIIPTKGIGQRIHYLFSVIYRGIFRHSANHQMVRRK